MIIVHLLSAFFFIATGLLLAAGERFKGTPPSRRAVLSSFVTLLIAVGLMMMHVPESNGGLMDPYQTADAKKKKQGDSSAKEDDDGEDNDDGQQEKKAESKSREASGASEKNAKADDPSRPFKDCEECPELVVVPAGHVKIGSAASDRNALPSEVPKRDIEQDALAVSKREISATEYGHFLKAVARWPNTCDGTRAPADGPAVCLTWNDARAYVRWLSRTTGKPYRLPSAAQWEYVARFEQTEGQQQIDVVGMGGGVAEFVGDCWQDMPDIEAERMSTQPWSPGCEKRVVKDAANDEDPRWRRPAARRAMDVSSTSLHVGFRVLRASSAAAH